MARSSRTVRRSLLRVGRWSLQGKRDVKRGADAWLALNGDAASMGIDDIFHNLCAQPCPADLSADGAVREEALEDFGWHAPTGIDDRHQDAPSRLIRTATQRDGSAG